MQVRYRRWILIILVMVGMLVPGKVLAQGGGDPCLGFACGGEWAGPGICIPYACPQDPPPPGSTACGDTGGGSCGGSCDNGAGCVSTEANPDCHCQASDGYTPMSCESGTTLACGSPTLPWNYDWGCQETNRSCDENYWPSKFTLDSSCAGGGRKGSCQDNCGCCNPGDTYQCTQTYGSFFEVSLGWSGNPLTQGPALCGPPTRGSYSSYRSGNCHWERIFFGDGDRDFTREWVCDYIITCEAYTQSCACVSSCSATAPTGVSVGAGPTPGTTAQVTWTPGSGGSSQRLYVGTNQAAVNGGCVDANNPCLAGYSPLSLSTSDGSELVTGLTQSTTYYFRVVTYFSASCSSGNTAVSYTTPVTTGNITGTVYLDTNNTCSTTTPWTSGGVSISLDSGAGTAINANGTYSVVAQTSSTHTLAVSIPGGYICSTTAGCNNCSLSGVVSPSPGRNFYLTTSRGAWWQAEGAGIYAGGVGGVRSILPRSSAWLILAPPGGTEGLLMTSDGSVDLGAGTVSDSLWMARSRYRGKKTDFDYFGANMGVVQSRPGDWTLTSTLDLVGYPEGSDFGYKNGAGVVESAMNVGVGESYVIFVNGNLDIRADITVAEGGFLAFIVNGNVSVDPSVSRLEGLYVIDDNFVTETLDPLDDVQLVTGGTIVAWGTLSLSRDMGIGNVDEPAEKFVYRSDLLTNMPDKMKTFLMQWNEVVPGTYQ